MKSINFVVGENEKIKKKKVNIRWYVLIALALFVGIIIGYLATTNLSVIGQARLAVTNKNLQVAEIEIRGTVQDCCNGQTPNGDYTYPPEISEGCCMLIDMGIAPTTEISELSDTGDCCTNEQWDQECCNESFKKLIAMID